MSPATSRSRSVMLLVMGLVQMGTMIRYIPYPVTTGFTSGIAVLIFSTQIKDFLGLKVDKVPADFVEKIRVLGAEDSGGSFLVSPALGLMVWTLVLFGITMLFLRKYAFPRIQEALDKRANAIRDKRT